MSERAPLLGVLDSNTLRKGAEPPSEITEVS
jgi:hypothetical protein